MATDVRTERITGIVVSHTHWDREWYLSFQRFRMMLVDAVDSLLDILDNDPDFQFTLDGQTVVLDDYLEIRPENEARLARYISEGRILVGPWYILPDEFLVTAESLVRNLLVGRKVARRFGPCMPVGYLPDTFGHPAQIPQILTRWGIDNAVLFRGIIPPAAEFDWEAPDGSRVLTIFMPGGYCNAAGLAASPDRFLQSRVAELIDSLRAMATTPNVLLMNGCDHFPPQRNLSDYIDRGNGQFEDVVLRQGTLPEYIELVKAAKPKLDLVKGEFRKPRPGRVTPGVLSARMYLKQQNFETSTILERYAEPLTALAWLTGVPHPDAYLFYAWKQLLQNHPHDSICGCSIDAVHRDMLARFHYAQDVGNELTRRSLAEIAAVLPLEVDDDGCAFLSFNPNGRSRQDYAHQVLHFTDRGRNFRLVDPTGKAVPHQIVSRRNVILNYQTYAKAIELDGRPASCNPMVTREEMARLIREGLWQRWEGEEVEVIFSAKLPAMGYGTYRVLPEAVDEHVTDLHYGQNWLENNLLRLEVDSYGRISVLDKRSGIVCGPLNVFEDGGDRGDEYTYCPPAHDSIVTSALTPAAMRLIEQGPVRASIEITTLLRVPRRLTKDRDERDDRSVEMRIVSKVSVSTGSPRVEFVTEVDNTAEDHRLRAVFTAPLSTDWSHAHGQFEVTRRAIDLDPAEVGRVPGNDEEVAVTSFPQASFVDVNDGRFGLSVLNRGLPEFEALRATEGTSIALTLLRCVGWLSRPDLATRFGNAGPMLPTPEAQCAGKHAFHYAIVPHLGTWDDAALPQEAANYVAPAIGSSIFARPRHNGMVSHLGGRQRLPLTFSYVSIAPGQVVLSAIKKAEGDDSLVVRVYNTVDRQISTKLTFGWPVRRVVTASLSEAELGEAPLAINNQSVDFDLAPCEIRTLLVSQNDNAGSISQGDGGVTNG